jgi:hypothetical protein
MRVLATLATLTEHSAIRGSVPIVMYIAVTVYVVQRSTTGQYAI